MNNLTTFASASAVLDDHGVAADVGSIAVPVTIEVRGELAAQLLGAEVGLTDTASDVLTPIDVVRVDDYTVASGNTLTLGDGDSRTAAVFRSLTVEAGATVRWIGGGQLTAESMHFAHDQGFAASAEPPTGPSFLGAGAPGANGHVGLPGAPGKPGGNGTRGGDGGDANLVALSIATITGNCRVGSFGGNGGKGGSGGAGGDGGTGHGGDGGSGGDGGNAGAPSAIHINFQNGNPVFFVHAGAGSDGQGGAPGEPGAPGAGNPSGAYGARGEVGTSTAPGEVWINGARVEAGSPPASS